MDPNSEETQIKSQIKGYFGEESTVYKIYDKIEKDIREPNPLS